MTDDRPAQLADFIESLPDFEWYQPMIPYRHMGATIADAVLQRTQPYRTRVEPRALAARAKYPNAATCSGLRELLQTTTIREFLHFDCEIRERTFRELVELFGDENIEDEEDLKGWLQMAGSERKLQNCYYVGPKTADYFKLRVGLTTTAAIDGRLTQFLAMAGIVYSGYDDAKLVFHGAAERLGRSPGVLDNSVWEYLDTRTTRC